MLKASWDTIFLAISSVFFGIATRFRPIAFRPGGFDRKSFRWQRALLIAVDRYLGIGIALSPQIASHFTIWFQFVEKT
jgi:hypothetical protein